ncbi:unnamed protein product [Rotaria magnacalcarata]|uniref:Uncharacterized protein n=3 Tax=Rotaria magnacalcarata TaxID=392030 RepID=A0A815WWW6_9BILA|nr:unnamed protein product [Rotaria magnacalcarata]
MMVNDRELNGTNVICECECLNWSEHSKPSELMANCDSCNVAACRKMGVHKKNEKKVQPTSNIPEYGYAIIIGGSFSAMATAAYLSKHFKRITIIESDDVLNDTFIESTPAELLNYHCRLESPTSIGRSGVSQIYQIHILAGEGFKILKELFPELADKLITQYGVRRNSLKNEAKYIINGVLINQNLTDDIE